MSAALIYITTENKAEAEKIGSLLVEKRLAACVNIIDGMSSIFWWNDKLDQARETILLAKTRQSLIRELTETVKSVHSYDCPCVIALPIIDGNADFIQWIARETG